MQTSSDPVRPGGPSRRGFLAAGFAAGLRASPLAAGTSHEGSFDLNELSITDLHKRLKDGKYTARSLVEKYLARIEATDRKGSTLRSVIEINPDALTLADELDKEFKKTG